MHRFGLLLGVSALAGLLVAGVLLPVVGGIGLAARTGANDWESLPAELAEPPLPQVSRILAADGSTLASFYYENRIPVRIAQVPKIMQKALIAIEDARFYEHNGIDIKGSLRALFRNSESGSVRQGGSTLTQQYVKNVLIESAQTDQGRQAAKAQTLGRKVREARYALELERRLTKTEILERYLNIAYFGDGAYGVGTAAAHYFSKPVSRLNLAESALLAGLVQSPEAYNPLLHPVHAQARRDVVLRQMLRYHFIDQAAYDAAVATPLKSMLRPHRAGNGCEGTSAPWFCDYVLKDFLADPSFGATESDRNKLLLRGGLTIRTTLDPKVQKAADQAVSKHVPANDPSGVAAAEAVVEPGTGKIKAIAVSAPFGTDKKRGETVVDYATDHDHGGSTGFPAGSTFKVFVLAAALKEGVPLTMTLPAPPRITLTGFRDCAGADRGPYKDVGNADPHEGGTFNLINGTWQSVNTFFVQLERRTGLCEPIKIAEAMGMRAENPATPGYPDIPAYPSFVLGGAATFSPLRLAEAYATFAANGKYCPPVAITQVIDRHGKALDLRPSTCSQVVEPGLAATITDILRGVVDHPGGTAFGMGLGRPSAGKTGTVDDYKAAWFAGYTPQLAAAVWVGHPVSPEQHPLRNVTIGGHFYSRVFGATVPAPIWHDTLMAALSGVPAVGFPRPDKSYLTGTQDLVPDVAGQSVADATAALAQAGFNPVVAPGQVASSYPAGTVAGTSPAAGSRLAHGSTVTILVSNGVPPPPSPTPTPTTTGTIETSPSPAPTTPAPSASTTPVPRPTKTHKPR
jgi:membrane peptidoglycan carboxypeptidase